ncbi:MAG: bifunctional 5,10-methylenetetrahydrofolate dehydrogenase/5,10-methenyltetrahydrofolate cyclohydrolase, partial [Candidatus Spechtbacterales bacterium]|nr:bifunctional 5,10-methylenetetrahydrofolate dehydrogenase/5,10-methenyltetrahydrofolate cyclohydrolase [Candidatus Spechtbacterales bacterium]
VLVQLPLPKEINTDYVLNTIKKEKDIDRLSKKSLGEIEQNTNSPLPPTVAGIMMLLDEYKIKTKGKHVVIVGHGRLVGRPISKVLKNKGATISIVDEFTPEETKRTLLKSADMVVSGVGKANLITKDMLKEGVVAIDAGISIKDGKLTGDIAENVKEVASYYTPVPGGIGPMTVAMLFRNLIELSK